MSKRIHIIIAEPSSVLRCGIVTLLQRSTTLNVEISEVTDLAALSTNTYWTKPDILIVNPSHLGLFQASQIRVDLDSESLKIVALQSSFVDQSLLNNYDEVVSIYESEESIIEKISKVIKESDEPDNRKELSVREKEIIVCVVKGLTNKQTADILNLSTHTVIAHRRNIATKLQIHSPSGLTIYAIVNKLVDLADVKNSITQNKNIE